MSTKILVAIVCNYFEFLQLVPIIIEKKVSAPQEFRGARHPDFAIPHPVDLKVADHCCGCFPASFLLDVCA